MPDVVSTKWLEENVGKPSGSWGSKYSRIYEATKAWEKAPSSTALLDVGRKTAEWLNSKHSGAKTADQVALKYDQHLALNRFASFVNAKLYEAKDIAFSRKLLQKLSDDGKYTKELAIVQETIDSMTTDSRPLICNTGRHLQGKQVIIVTDDKTNGSMDINGVLSVNPVLAYNRVELYGLLVHETHHYLCQQNGNYTYLDEFVAHMKQYSVTRKAMSEKEMVDNVNKILAINYASITKRWTTPKSQHGMGCRLVEKFDDLGDFLVPDNQAKVRNPFKHGCEIA
jgi:hypothetical protein